MIIDVTEIHMRYGLEMLRTNYECYEWIRTRPVSQQGTSVSRLEYAQSRAWSDQMNELSDRLTSQNIGTQANASDLSQITTRSDIDRSSLRDTDNEGVSVIPVLDKGKKTEKTFASAVRPQTEKQIASGSSEPKQAKSEERSNQQKPVEALSKEAKANRDHLINDLVLIAKTAFNMHASQRDWIKVLALKESILSESDLRGRFGVKYVASNDTSLDGNKALAKEIIAKHSTKEVHDWESGVTTSHGAFCLLNCKFMPLSSDDTSELLLCEELVKAFHSLTEMNMDNQKIIQHVREATTFELSRSGNPTVYDWMKNRAKFIEVQRTKKSTSTHVADKGKQLAKSNNAYPAIDQRVLDHINSNLQVIVNEASNRADELPQTIKKEKIEKVLFKFASEFIRRNKGWHNENSFTSPQHLSRLEDLTELGIESDDAYPVFIVLKKIIDNFRRSFKDKFPKAST